MDTHRIGIEIVSGSVWECCVCECECINGSVRYNYNYRHHPIGYYLAWCLCGSHAVFEGTPGHCPARTLIRPHSAPKTPPASDISKEITHIERERVKELSDLRDSVNGISNHRPSTGRTPWINLPHLWKDNIYKIYNPNKRERYSEDAQLTSAQYCYLE